MTIVSEHSLAEQAACLWLAAGFFLIDANHLTAEDADFGTGESRRILSHPGQRVCRGQGLAENDSSYSQCLDESQHPSSVFFLTNCS